MDSTVITDTATTDTATTDTATNDAATDTAIDLTPDSSAATAVRAAGHTARRRSERAEGVISTAVAVLIVAFLGIGLWKGFGSMMNSASQRTRTQVEQIGR